MREDKKRVRELTHTWVIDEMGNPVSAESVTPQDKVNHRYYIIGQDSQGNEVRERVFHVPAVKMRKHFKRYASKATHTQDGEEIKRVISIGKHCETIVHSLAKKLFKNGSITWLKLPKSVIRTRTGAVMYSTRGIFNISDVEIEKTYQIPELATHVRFDVFARNTVLNKQLGIEIYVNHRSDASKITKLKELNFSTLEIDLSSLANIKDINDPNLENRIIDIIRSGENSIWLREFGVDSFIDALDNIVCVDRIERSRYENDGRYIMYKDKVKDYIPKCNHIINWDGNNRSGNRDRYITETQCKTCQRFIGVTKTADNKTIVMCNQSDYTSKSLMCALIKMMKLG